MWRKLTLVTIVLFGATLVYAQDDLLDLLEEEQEEQKEYVSATFKGTRLINGHSVETRNKNVLDFIISHRFGTLNSGAYRLFGLDEATIRLGLEYAITDQFYIGIGRSSYQKTYDGFAKYRILRQSTGPGSAPLSITWFGSMASMTLKIPDESLNNAQRLAYTHQLLMARKFSSSFSFQLMPTFVHYNYISQEDDNNDIYALGAGGRFMITKRFGIAVEYYYTFQGLKDEVEPGETAYHDPLAIGIVLETGGHVFQLQFTNASAMFEKGFIGETTNDFFGGDIHFGFNISRTFQIGGH